MHPSRTFLISVRRAVLRDLRPYPLACAALLPWASARGRARLRYSRGTAHAELVGSRAAY